jgi:hypothetical protein
MNLDKTKFSLKAGVGAVSESHLFWRESPVTAQAETEHLLLSSKQSLQRPG